MAVRRLRWALREAGARRADRGVRPVEGPQSPDPVAVISPHLDDAVLSCGQAIAARPGSTVVTVLTRSPGIREWERSCGFRPGDDVSGTRRREDREALALLRADPVWLDLEEGSAARLPADAVAAPVSGTLARLGVTTVLAPLGLGHADHVAVADAVLGVDLPGVDRLLYADQPYAGRRPDDVEQRLRVLAERGVELEAAVLPIDGSVERKRAAIHRYVSQCRPLWGDLPLALAPERYWRVVPAAR